MSGFWRLIGLKTRRDRKLAVAIIIAAVAVGWRLGHLLVS